MATKAPKAKSQDNAESNRMKRLLRTQKAQPNNLQVQAALKTTRMHRKTPVNPVWSASWRAAAQVFKLFNGSFNPAIMSSNPEVARNALAKLSAHIVALKAPTVPANAFSMEARIKGGAASWN